MAGVDAAGVDVAGVGSSADSGAMNPRLRRARTAGAAPLTGVVAAGARGVGGCGAAPRPVVTPGMTPKALRSGSAFVRPAVGLIAGVVGHASAAGAGTGSGGVGVA